MADGIESPCQVERYDRYAVISRKEFGGMICCMEIMAAVVDPVGRKAN